MRIYLVGGCVRDELLGRVSKDRDYVVFGCTEREFFKRFPRAIKVGKKIPVYLVGRDEYTISGCKNIHEDLMSRDLTINAMAKDNDGNLFSHPMALSDLKNKIIRPISLENFIKDPLRVHRAARFYAQFPDFSIDPELISIMKRVGSDSRLMRRISKERVCQELIKATGSSRPSKFFSLLLNTNSISYWFEELDLVREKKDWLRIMDGVSGNNIRVLMALTYGFILNLQDIEKSIMHYRNMALRIGLPKSLYNAGVSFLKFYTPGSRLFSISPRDIRDTLYVLHRQGLITYFFQVIEQITQREFLDKVLYLTEIFDKVKLPQEFRGLGPKSGEILKDMQIDELKKCLNSL